MALKKHLSICLQGAVVVAPAVITAYVCVKVIVWLDNLVLGALGSLVPGLVAEGSVELQNEVAEALLSALIPGIGIVVALAALYIIGLLTRNWLFRKMGGLGEAVVQRIPLVKSLYSAIKDLLQLVGGGEATSRGVPAKVSLLDGKVDLLGIITQKDAASQVGEGGKDRVAVYLPMSLQIGGFTVYVPADMVEEIPDMDVETLMKLSMTAGVGRTRKRKAVEPAPGDQPAKGE